MTLLTIEGYASRFHERDLNNDVVATGAFRQTLCLRPALEVNMLYQHDTESAIGLWDMMVEDSIGLFVRGRILDLNTKAQSVARLIRSGIIDGLSIGFHAQKSRREPGQSLRILTQIDLLEVSVVCFPMLPSARLSCVKDPSSSSLKIA